MAKLKAMARRGVVSALVACGALGIVAPAALANHIEGVSVNASCTAVTFSYMDFIPGSPSSPTNFTEKLFLNGSSTPVATATYAETGPATFSSTFTTPAVPLPGAANGDKLVAEAYWSGNGNNVHPASNPDVFPTITLSGCPLTYTGDAYNVDAKLKLLGISQELGPVHDTGEISTTTPATKADSAVPLTGTLLNVGVLNWNYAIGGDSSSFEAQTDNVGLTASPIPGISTGEVDATSTTTCPSGTLATTGSTYISYLKIGATTVVGTGPTALLGPGYFTNKTVVGVPGVASLVLGEQLPFTDGLTVNAIDLKITVGSLSSLQLIVSHAESDIEGC